MFYTNNITEERLKEIRDILQDKNKVVHSNGMIDMSDGRRLCFPCEQQWGFLIFDMSIPKNESKRQVYLECKNLIEKTAWWKRFHDKVEKI